MESQIYSIHNAAIEDLKFFYKYGTKEINQGYHIYYKFNPNTFFLGKLKNINISKIFFIKYSKDYAHIGGYYVDQQYRKKGYGIQIFRKVLDQLNECKVVTLGSIQDQVKNYQKSNFKVVAPLLIRYIAVIPQIDQQRHTNIKKLNEVNKKQLLQFDKQHTPFDLSAFLQDILVNNHSFISIDKVTNSIVGYICMTKFDSDYAINMLVAVNNLVAQDLVKQALIVYKQLKRVDESLISLKILSFQREKHVQQFLSKWFPDSEQKKYYWMIWNKSNIDIKYFDNHYALFRK